jgi:thioredoxin-like negative regulator of GroEL|tara:strand:+ start:516 stop:842 length:327 start_codon:yes stop_codon:yes gene_type:complete
MIYIINKDNKKEINNLLLNDKKIIVLYYSAFCGYCRDLLPLWIKIIKKYVKSKIKIVNVESDNIKYVKKKFRDTIDGYPTIMKYRYGKPVEEFVSKKNYKNLKKFIEK